MNKIDLHYKVEGDGKACVFLHGLSDDLNYWEFLAKNLQSKFKVIRFDLPGHGQSELCDEITIDIYANNLIAILNELNVDKINLVGFSLGGAIALYFTLKYPEMVDCLVLMSSFAKTDDHIMSIFTEFKKALNISFEEFYDLILPMVLCPDVIEANRDELDALKHIAAKTANTQAYIKAIEACSTFDLEGELQKIDVPTLLIAGKYDKITTADSQRDICEKIENSRLIVLDDVRHNLLVGQDNEKVLGILEEFLKE